MLSVTDISARRSNKVVHRSAWLDHVGLDTLEVVDSSSVQVSTPSGLAGMNKYFLEINKHFLSTKYLFYIKYKYFLPTEYFYM